MQWLLRQVWLYQRRDIFNFFPKASANFSSVDKRISSDGPSDYIVRIRLNTFMISKTTR